MSERSGEPRALFPRPGEREPVVARERVEGTCPACSKEKIAVYPVLRVGGWARLTRCQSCLKVLDSEPAPSPYGFTYLPHGTYLRDQSQRT